MNKKQADDFLRIKRLRNNPWSYNGRNYKACPWWAIAMIMGVEQYLVMEAYKKGMKPLEKGDRVFDLSAPWSGKVSLINLKMGYAKVDVGNGIDKMIRIKSLQYNPKNNCYGVNHATKSN
jgi:hypothetical protein